MGLGWSLLLLGCCSKGPASYPASYDLLIGLDVQVMLGPFESCKLLLDSRTGSKMKVWDKLDHFFVDYDMMPLLVQVLLVLALWLLLSEFHLIIVLGLLGVGRVGVCGCRLHSLCAGWPCVSA